jgi:CRISPR/Cas system endoribonuclease Cas6 (RAMP superfamily)
VHAAALPADEIRLRFLTPTRLIQGGDTVERPPFHVLARRLLDRVDSLSYFHCGERWQADFRALGQQAEEIEMAECHTRWMQVERYSGRQQERVSLGGFVGEVVYRGDLAPFRSLLVLGTLIHVGKATIFGNGLYEIVM